MDLKRKTSGEKISVAKRARNVMTLHKKVEVLGRLARGESCASVGRLMGVNESTIRTIKKCEVSIRTSVERGTSATVKVSHIPRDSNIEKMEKALHIWIEVQMRNRAPLSALAIREKAMQFYNHFVSSGGHSASKKFAASKGWLENFKKRYNLHNLQIPGKMASADGTTVLEYPDMFMKLIDEKGYSREQVLNADETGLFWKRLPYQTSISNSEKRALGLKVAKDQITLLLCSNAAGDFIMKPMLLYQSPNPRALAGKIKTNLPVYLTSNKKAWVDCKIFMDWFHNCFVPDVEKYLASKNLPFKALLVLESAPGHPKELISAHPNVEVLFLPPNTMSLLQPLDQGIISTFKIYYIRRTLSLILEIMVKNNSLSVLDCWKKFNIANCITVIKESIDEMKQTTLNSCWHKLWPEAVSEFKGFPDVGYEVEQIITIASLLKEGLKDMQPSDVEELLHPHHEEPSKEELERLVAIDSEKKEEVDGEEEELSNFTMSNINKIMEMATELSKFVVSMDPQMDRSLIFKRGLDELLHPYKEVQMSLHKKMSQP